MVPKILIVDDTAANLVAMRSALRDLPLELYEATSGNDALSLLLRHRIDMVFMDVRMPLMDGYETTECLRQLDEYKDIPVIFVTGNDAPQEQESSNFFYDHHIQKPIDRDEIRRIIQAILFDKQNS